MQNAGQMIPHTVKTNGSLKDPQTKAPVSRKFQKTTNWSTWVSINTLDTLVNDY